jgi:hypothetical protein
MKRNNCTAESCEGCMWVKECLEEVFKPDYPTCYKCGQRTDNEENALCPGCHKETADGLEI